MRPASPGKEFPTLSEEREAEMRKAIAEARAAGDSLGGVIECAVVGVPAGLGDPMFDGMENRLAAILFGIPAVKGVEFGAGFAAAAMSGSENNDAFAVENGRVVTRTNHSGGILGGITTGMPVEFAVAVKPTPSIAKRRRPWICARWRTPRSRAAGTIPASSPGGTLCGGGGRAGGIRRPAGGPLNRKEESSMDLNDYRLKIDAIDKELLRLFSERMDVAPEIAAIQGGERTARAGRRTGAGEAPPVAETAPGAARLRREPVHAAL